MLLTNQRCFLIAALLPLALTGTGCSLGSYSHAEGRQGLRDSPSALTMEHVENAVRVLAIVEPAAESVCGRFMPHKNCDLMAVVAGESDRSMNAYQIGGQTTIVFTRPLLAHFRNDDELAFSYAHEAAHYILRHHETIMTGEIRGAGTRRSGNRVYSPQAEFEADMLGAEITLLAGYDPAVGVLVFDYLPEASRSAILPSHPPNKERIARVREYAAARAPSRTAVPVSQAEPGEGA